MTDTPTEEREVAPAEATPAVATPPVAPAEKVPFWDRPYVERYLTPIVLPVAVVVGLVAYILNISRIFLSGHGHIPIFVGSAITAMILIGATVLSAGAQRLRGSAITLITAAFVFSIFSSGWLVLGHAQPEKTGPVSLASTLKTTQTVKVTAAPGGALKFAPDSITAKTGLALMSVSVASPGHTFNLADAATTLFPGLSLNAGGATVTGVAFFPKPGSYTFFCAIPGHEAAGMKGVITVTGPAMTLPDALKASGNPATAAG